MPGCDSAASSTEHPPTALSLKVIKYRTESLWQALEIVLVMGFGVDSFTGAPITRSSHLPSLPENWGPNAGIFSEISLEAYSACI